MGKSSKKKKFTDSTDERQISNKVQIDAEKTSGKNVFLKPAVQIICIIILGVIVYSNTFNSPFIFDDHEYIIQNPAIKDFSFFLHPSKIDLIPNYLISLKEQFKSRILTHITFTINYKVHGLDVKGYHLANLLIHILNALLVYLIINLTFKTPFLKSKIAFDPMFNSNASSLIAFLCALLFAVHPIQTQAVTYISQRFASLATLFYLLSLIFYIKARISEQSSRHYIYYFISLVATIFSMKTKEISFTLPIVIIGYEVMFLEGSLKKRILYLLPFVLSMAIIPITLLHTESFSKMFSGIEEASKDKFGVSRSDYLFTQFAVITTYLRLLVLPINQNLDYAYPVYSSFFQPQVYLTFLLLLSILVFGGYLFYRSREKNRFSWYFRLISFGIFYFFITLSVESSIIPIRDLIFEHRVYLPSFGFLLSIATGIMMISKLKVKTFNRMIIPASFFIVILLAGIAYLRNEVWKNPVSLWEDVVKKSPFKDRPHYNLALSYNDFNLLHAAINEDLIAIEINPNYFGAHHNLGDIYSKLNLLEKAVAEYLIAIKLKPNEAITHNNLGITYFKLNLLEEAVAEYRRAIELKPNDAITHSNLGITYFKLNLLEEAVAEYRRAIELKPNDAEIHMNLGVAYYKQGRFKDACEETLHAIKLDPNSIDAHYNLAIYYSQQGKFAEAIEEYSIVTKLDPNNEEAHNAIGILSEKLKMQLKSTKK